MKPILPSCKTCKWLDVAPDRRGRRVVRSERVYRCTVPMQYVKLPDCVKQHYSFRWPPHRDCMQGSDGENCITWERIDQ